MQTATGERRDRVCPACGGNSTAGFASQRINPERLSAFSYASRKTPEFMCLRLVRCLECDLVYAPEPPTPDVLSQAYSEASFDSGDEAAAAAGSYAKALAPHLARLAGRKGAVDVGAGSGPLLPWLCGNGFHPVIGIEPSRSAIDAAPDTIRPLLRQGMFSPSTLQDVPLSLVCSFMTLEHLADPGGFVASAYELLDPGGMLAVVVHDWRAQLNRLLGLRSPIIDLEHLQLYSPKSVRTLLTRAGFVSLELQTMVNSYPLRYWLRLMPLPGAAKSKILDALARISLSQVKLSLRVGNMLVVGRKPEGNTSPGRREVAGV